MTKKCKIMSQFLLGGRGSDFKPKCHIVLCPKVPTEGGCQARMGQCLIFLFFLFFLKAFLKNIFVSAKVVRQMLY